MEYSIDGGQSFQSESSFAQLGPGSYEVVVGEVGKPGCAEVYASNPIALLSPTLPNITSVNAQPSSDCSLDDGSINITAEGSNLEYSIDNGQTYSSSGVFENLATGFYEVWVREQGNPSCSVSYLNNPVEVSSPSSLTLDEVLFSPSLSDCGVQDGSITINATGNSLEYSIDGGTNYQSSPNFSGLDAGSYTVMIREVAQPSCLLAYVGNPIEITSPTLPTISQVSSLDVSDCGLVDGSIDIEALGNNLEYSIDGGVNFQASSSFTGLDAGSYEVRVREVGSNTCISNYLGNPIVLTTPSVPVISSVSPVDISDCGLQDGGIEVFATGTSLEYSLDGNTYQTSSIFSNLTEGSYTVFVREQGYTLCVTSIQVNIAGPTDCEECFSNNLALGGTATQSTTRGDGSANLAIDGNLVGDDNWGDDANLQHTETQANSWWKVDLGVEATLDSVLIYNRSTTQGWLLARLKDFYVYVSTQDIAGTRSISELSNDPTINSFFFSGNAGQLERISLNSIQGRYVLIKLPSNGPLHLAEVEVYGCDGPPPPCDVVLTDVTASDETDCGLSNGSLTIQATGSNLEYSIDGGSTYSSSPVFSDLAPGSYSVVIRNANQPNCTATYPSNPILIQGPSLPTITDIANSRPECL